ncbi:MAG TPA: NADPH-dependent assimilatory sulfite reductase hemoprotein subunit [Myxococcota bacterium]|nr:NADPH-dependent assimilatory sulfite reductase hemoprotein subunit [Myxococcota bacterium]
MSDSARDWTPPDKPAVTLENAPLEAMSKNERIKVESQGLFFASDGKSRHAFAEEVDQLTRGERETIGAEAKELSKFYGIYKQQERGERGRKTGDYIFMARIKCPAGGELSAAQWAAIDDAADLFADGTIRLTSRQSIQYHHVYGPKLAPLIRHLSRRYRTDATLSACGDVNRNVMTSPADGLFGPDVRARELAYELASELAPRSSAYFQVWSTDDQGRTVAPLNTDEPIYGPHYLPRKFKIGITHPDDNSIDVRTQDVGFVPAADDGSLWDLWSGGGMGQSHNNPTTAPLLGLSLGRIPRDQVVAATRAIAILQRDKGERRDRKQARWKYTIRRLGVDEVKRLLRERFSIPLADAEPRPLPSGRLFLGWQEALDGTGCYGLSVENGRLRPELRKGIRAAVDTLDLRVRLTPHQDLLLCGVRDREELLRILDAHGVPRPKTVSPLRSLAMACPAKPTCGLAMTDAEGILPSWLDEVEAAGLGDVPVEIRMTGCPNNCARPPSAEVGIFGYGKNDHVVLVGGSKRGDRIARTLYARIPGERMVPVLIGLLRAVKERAPAGVEPGDWLWAQDPALLRSWIGVDDAA